MSVKKYSFKDVPTIKQFCSDRSFIHGIMGPFGSGKSVGCVMHLVQLSKVQKPGPDGVRRTRWAIIRNSFPQLRDTTIPTTFDWIEELGEYHKTDYDFVLNKITADDGSPVEAKFHFRALDTPRDIRNLLSLELTGAWFNEVKEIPRSIFDTMRGRVGRYPSMNNGGATWNGIIFDTNPPDTDHWIYKLCEVDKPQYCFTCRDKQGGVILLIDKKCPQCKGEVGVPFIKLFKQPSGIGPNAENLTHLIPGYYANLCAGMDKEFIRVYAEGQYGYISDGKPVYAIWNDEKYIAKEILRAVPGIPLIIGFDNTGRDQAAVICQYMPSGQFRILHEFIITDVSTRTLVREFVKPFVISTYPGVSLVLTGDPAGVRRGDTDDRNTFQEIYDAFQISATPARSNALSARLGSVDSLMKRYLGGDKYGLLVSPECTMIIKGFRGEYKLRRIQVIGKEKYVDKPEKNLVSHGHDALQYAAMAVEDALTLLSDAGGDIITDQHTGTIITEFDWSAFT